MVEKIKKTIYKTKDGEEFFFLVQAKHHEAKVYLDDCLTSLLIKEDFASADARASISDFIYKYKADLMLILTRHSVLMPTEEEIKTGEPDKDEI